MQKPFIYNIYTQHATFSCDFHLISAVSKNGILSIHFVGNMFDMAAFNRSLGEKILAVEKEFVGNILVFDEYASS